VPGHFSAPQSSADAWGMLSRISALAVRIAVASLMVIVRNRDHFRSVNL